MSGKKHKWTTQMFPSGTCIVTRKLPARPHYYVYAAPNRTRIETCEDLATWLNGDGPWPEWAGKMSRKSDEAATHSNGQTIVATGPYVDRDGSLDWTDDNEHSVSEERKYLIDILLSGEASND